MLVSPVSEAVDVFKYGGDGDRMGTSPVSPENGSGRPVWILIKAVDVGRFLESTGDCCRLRLFMISLIVVE